MSDYRVLMSSVLILLAMGLGCERSVERVTVSVRGSEADLIGTSYKAVDVLLGQRLVRVDPSRRLLVANLVDLNDVQATSTFGRMVTEFLSARLAHHGFAVVHMGVRKESIVINDNGKFLLSNDMQLVANDYDAATVLVGTYMVAMDKIYISLRIVNAPDNQMLAAVDYEIPKGPKTMVLLRRGQAIPRTNASIYEAKWDPTLR